MGATIEQEHRLHADICPECKALRAENERLREVLTELFGLIESGYLVRDISRDAEPGWAMRQLPAVMILKRAAMLVHPEAAALAQHEPEAEK
jgi:hypothetical protein